MKKKTIRGNRAASEIAHVHASIIELDNKPRRVYNFRSQTKHDEWTPCKCLLCGMDFDVLTLHHAEMHGFKSTREMLNAGVVKHFFDSKDTF